jgi:hypothetical protein
MAHRLSWQTRNPTQVPKLIHRLKTSDLALSLVVKMGAEEMHIPETRRNRQMFSCGFATPKLASV